MESRASEHCWGCGLRRMGEPRVFLVLYPWAPKFQGRFAGPAVSPAWEWGRFDGALIGLASPYASRGMEAWGPAPGGQAGFCLLQGRGSVLCEG